MAHFLAGGISLYPRGTYLQSRRRAAVFFKRHDTQYLPRQRSRQKSRHTAPPLLQQRSRQKSRHTAPLLSQQRSRQTSRHTKPPHPQQRSRQKSRYTAPLLPQQAEVTTHSTSNVCEMYLREKEGREYLFCPVVVVGVKMVLNFLPEGGGPMDLLPLSPWDCWAPQPVEPGLLASRKHFSFSKKKKDFVLSRCSSARGAFKSRLFYSKQATSDCCLPCELRFKNIAHKKSGLGQVETFDFLASSVLALGHSSGLKSTLVNQSWWPDQYQVETFDYTSIYGTRFRGRGAPDVCITHLFCSSRDFFLRLPFIYLWV